MTTLPKLQPASVIDETARLLTEHYVFPEIAEQLAGLLKRRLTEGAYDVGEAGNSLLWSPRTCSPSTATGT